MSDYTGIYLISLVFMGLSYIISRKLTKKMEEYGNIPLPGGMTGADVARRMLSQNGINDVKVTSVSGSLTDHFNPTDKTVNLSDDVCNVCSIAAAAVAAHECGHAVQHARGYAPVKLRTRLVPVVNFANKWTQWVLLAGVVTVSFFPGLLVLGCCMFALSTLFSLVTLPVEIDASRRAVAWLDQAGIVSPQTKPLAQDALKWAAYTYVISALGSLATLFYYIRMARSR